MRPVSVQRLNNVLNSILGSVDRFTKSDLNDKAPGQEVRAVLCRTCAVHYLTVCGSIDPTWCLEQSLGTCIYANRLW